MTTPEPDDRSEDEPTRLFLEFLDQEERGVRPDFSALLAAHPEHADTLRRRHADWKRMRVGLGAEETVDPEPAWRRFLARLRSRGDGWRRYRDDGELARGGMGVIRQVFDEDTRRDLAMKVILSRGRPDDVVPADDAILGRFLEEAQVTAQLDHPGIVPVHEVGVDGAGRVYFTMKLVRGEDLRSVFDKVRAGEEGWSRTRVVSVLLRVCEALAYAHAKGVIHRDVKPGNVMVGRFGEAYVMDWGLARVLGAAPPVRSTTEVTKSIVRTERRDEASDSPRSPLLTVEGDVVGTPFYMAPEQAAGHLDRLGPHTDVYAVGAMLYHLLAGRMPYASPDVAASPEAVLGMVLHGPPRPLAEAATGAPPELVAICERAMARDVAERYATMSELSDDLRAYLEGRVVRAHATGPVQELRKWVARNRALAAAIGVAGLLAVGAAGLFGWQERTKATAVARERDVAWAVSRFQSDLLTLDPWVDGKDISAVDLVDRAAARLDEFVDDPEIEGWLRFTLGSSLESYGRMEDAERELRVALDRFREVYGEDHESTNDARDRLSWLIHQRGDHASAAAMMRDVLAWCRSHRGPRHAETLSAMSNLAAALDSLDRDQESEVLVREVLEVRLETLPPDDPKRVQTMGNYAAILANTGRYEEAERWQRQVVEFRRRHSSPNDPELWRATMNLGRNLANLDRGEEAEPLLVESAERQIDVLGRDHPSTLIALASLAEFLEEKGLTGEAALILEEIATRAATQSETYHEAAFDAWYRLALHREVEGRVAESITLIRHLVEVRRQRFDEAHPRLAWTLRGLASMLQRVGELAEAEATLLCALDLDLRHRGEDHPATWSTRLNLCGIACLRGRHRESIDGLTRVIEARRRIFGDGHRAVLEARMNLANEHAHLGDPEEAARVSIEVVDALDALDPDRPETLMAVLNLGINLEALGRFEEAEARHRRVVVGYRALFGDDDLRTLRAKANLAMSLLHLERDGEAEELFRAVERTRTARLGAESVPALEAAAGLALALHRLGREAESRVLSDRALAGVLPHADAGTRRSAGFAAGLLYSLARDRGDEETEQRLLAGWPSLSTSP